MKGIIAVNRFGFASQTYQAQRLKEEFNKLGVETTVVNDGALKCSLENGKVKTLLDCDFCMFLDKDKYLSAALTACGIRLFNSHEAIRVCDDKGETYIALSGKGFNLPETYFAPLVYDEEKAYGVAVAEEIGEKLGFPVVVKESYGSMGTGVYLAENKEQLAEISGRLALKPHIYQRYLSAKKGTDVRVIVIGGKAVAAMERYNPDDFRSNLALGGTGKAAVLIEEFKDAAERAAKTLKLDYCGVDLLYGDRGEPYICEVNSNAFFKGTEKVTGVNVAEIYAKYVADKLR